MKFNLGNIFTGMMDKMFGKGSGNTAIPGAMGDLLAQLGIYELGPHMRKGTPINVLMGCKKESVLIPGATQPAKRKDGSPLISVDKHGRPYQVMDNLAIDKKTWKGMVNDQKRKHNKRWYSGEPADVRAARLGAA